jgi:hypothetical protein
MTTATALKPSAPKQLPPPNSDFYQLADLLTAEESSSRICGFSCRRELG